MPIHNGYFKLVHKHALKGVWD